MIYFISHIQMNSFYFIICFVIYLHHIYPYNNTRISNNNYILNDILFDSIKEDYYNFTNIYQYNYSTIKIKRYISKKTNPLICVFGVLVNDYGLKIEEEISQWLFEEYEVYKIYQKYPGILYEYPALRFAQWLTENKNISFLLYLHTKGATHTNLKDGDLYIRKFWKKEFILAFSNLSIRKKSNDISFNKINNTLNILKIEDFINNKTKSIIFNGNPIISILLVFENLRLNDERILNLISILLNQTFKDIEIIILSNSSEPNDEKVISTYQLITKRIYKLKYNYWIQNIFDIINKIDGKYLIMIDKFFGMEKDDLYKIYILTKGSINNIFKYQINKENFLYLIRTKILRDISDLKIKFENFQEIINFVSSYPLPKINYIPIAYSPDNKYVNLCYTSMLSVLSSKAFLSYILFFLLIPKKFTKRNMEFLESLYEQYDYFNITFIQMDDRYKTAFISRYLTIQTYYRYSLGDLIPKLDKIIYLDADTICFTDLSAFFNLNFKGKIILGRILQSHIIDKKRYYSINCGILLLNLKEMREKKIEKKILNILKEGFGHNKLENEKIKLLGIDIHTADQALINTYFYEYIGLFPPKYNGLPLNYEETIKFNNNAGNVYNNDYLYFSFKFPSIRHYPGLKNNLFNREEWSFFAKKSKYFQKISSNFSQIYNY